MAELQIEMNLKIRQERLVFVDPEDEEIPYWWPAIVIIKINREFIVIPGVIF